MSIHSKLFLLTALILTLGLSFGGWLFSNSINAVFEKKSAHDTSHDAQMIRSYIDNKVRDIERKAVLISEDEVMKASLNLITNYQDPTAYEPLVFDLEKKEVLRQLERWTQPRRNLSVRLFDASKELVLQKDFHHKSADSGYISYGPAGESFLVSKEEKVPYKLRPQSIKPQHVITKAEDGFYTLSYTEEVKSDGTLLGYVEVGYWLSLSDLQILNNQLIHTVGLHTPDDNFSLMPKVSDDTKAMAAYESTVYEANTPLIAKHYVDKSFILSQQEKVFGGLIVAGILVVLISYGALSYFIKQIVILPLNRLKEAIEFIKTDQYTKGDLGVSRDEFGKILQYFDEVFEKLSQSYAFLDSYKKAVDEAVIVSQTNLDGDITFVNEMFLQKTGFTIDEVMGKPHNIVRHPDVPKETFRQLWQTIKQGEVWKGKVPNRTKKGDTLWLDVVISPITDSQGSVTGYMSIKKDITLLKTIQEKLEEAKGLAEHASQAKSDFVANMSHEIRTPMNAIIGLSELLKDTQTTPEQEKMLSKILGASKLLLNIINDILDFSKIEAGHLELEAVPMEMETLFEQMDAMFEEKARAKGIGFEMHAEQDVPAVIVTDAFRLQQVLANLLGNAIKFTEKGSVALHVDLYEKCDDTHAVLCFYVKDTGIGIAQDKITSLFAPFSQADTSTTRKYGGSGLGLVITQKILGAMGSKVEIQSQEGKGTQCQFCLEVEVDSWERPLVKPYEPEHLPANLAGVRILLVEDNEINQEVAVHMLKKLGAEVETASDGKEGLEMLETLKQCDVVLMDIQMPIMGGYEATRQIRKKGQKIPIIALTAAAMIEDREKALEAGMNDHLGKPIDPQQLYEKVAFWANKEAKEPVTKKKATVDMKLLEEATGDDEALKARLLKKFHTQLSETFVDLPEQIETKDPQARKQVHTLKGVSGSVGATALFEVLSDIDATYKQDESILPKQVAKLRETLQAVKEELASLETTE